uniref:Ig-like domain-containing protein n=2 Tax=Anabas testudineus TaxID=64144 RepID=A0A3Q1I307_ANATE
MAVRDTASLLVGLVVLLHTWGAWADVEVNMEDRVEVLRGNKGNISCMFKSDEGIGGIIIEWFYLMPTGEKKQIFYQDATKKLVLRDRISVSGSVADGEVILTIDNVQLQDELEFICEIKDLVGGKAEGSTKLRVFETPQPPTIEAVSTGISVNENQPSKIGMCEVKNGYPKPNITWYRNNMPLRSSKDVSVIHRTTVESSGLFSVKSELSKEVTKEDKDAQFYCEASYFVPWGTGMRETNTINITVYYPPTAVRVWVESPKGKIKEGDSIEFHCEGNGNSPSSLLSIWHEGVEHVVENNVCVLRNVTRLHSGIYRCTSLDMETIEEISETMELSVNYLDPAVVEPNNAIVVAQGEDLEATCNALSSLKTNTAWFKNGKEVLQGHTLNLKNASFDTAGTYVCVVTVPEIKGMETSATFQVDVKGPPKIIEPDNTEVEESFENSVDLSCVVRGFPAPSITWSTADGKVLKESSQTVTDEGVEGVVKVKVTSDITVVCTASNEYGTDQLTFSIKAKGSGVVIAVIIICILLLAILGSVLYFLYKTGRICGRSGKEDLTKEKSNKDNIVVEMKSDNTEEAILLGVNGEKQPSSDQ